MTGKGPSHAHSPGTRPSPPAVPPGADEAPAPADEAPAPADQAPAPADQAGPAAATTPSAPGAAGAGAAPVPRLGHPAMDPGEDRPGDPVCLLRRVCPACGAVADADPPTVCPQCHTRLS